MSLPLRGIVSWRVDLKWLLKVAVAVGILAWLLAGADVEAIARLLTGISPLVLAGFMAGQLLAIYVATCKWHLLLPDREMGLLWRLNLMAQFYSLIVPGQVGAEAIKAYQLGRGRPDAERVAASVLLDKVTSLISLLMLGILGAIMTSLPVGVSARASLLLLLVACLVVMFALRWAPAFGWVNGAIAGARERFKRADRVFSQLQSFLISWRAYLDEPGRLAFSIVVGLVYQGIYVILVYVLAGQLGFVLPVLEWCWIFALVSIAAIAPITVAGVGVREGVFVLLLSAFGIPAEQALALSLAMFFLHVLMGLVGAVLIASWRDKSR